VVWTTVRLTLLAALAGLLLAATPALAVPCGKDRCRSLPAPGADGAISPGPDGALWYAGDGFVGRVTPGGDVKRFPAPTTSASDVETGPDGGIWFTAPGVVGRMDTAGNVTLQQAVSGTPGPIAPAGDGAMWFAGSGGFVSRLAPDGALMRLALPGRGSGASAARSVTGGPGTMVKGPDGALWFVHSDPAGIGRIGPDGDVTEHPIPGAFGSELAGITAGPDGGLWFTAPKARMVGRMSAVSGHVISFHTSWNPYAITSGPSHAVWFAMTDSGRWTITRLVPAGYMSFFQVSGAVHGLAAGPDDGIYIAHGSSVERLEPFIGAYPIRSRKLKVNRFAGSTSMRLYCSWYDLVFCAGRIVLRSEGRVIASTPFSQRVNDAPATRILLNRLGRRLTAHSRSLPVTATITQHDQGGTTRVRDFDFKLVRRK
jgi:virginiamycin B lyase